MKKQTQRRRRVRPTQLETVDIRGHYINETIKTAINENNTL